MNISEDNSLSPELQAVEEKIVEVIVCRDLTEVDATLKWTLLLSQHSNSLPGPLTSLKVIPSSTSQSFTVERRMKRVGGREANRMPLMPDSKKGLEAYREGKPLFVNLSKISQVRVVEATTGLPERQVVIKSYQCNRYGLNDVLREAVMMMKVENKYACRLLDISLELGTVQPFKVDLVIERLEGDLKADIRQQAHRNQPYEEAELLHILRDVADALVFAKLRGIAHRDIKPDNILKDENDYKLGDFGSACAADQRDSPADGTSDYLSPEMRHRLLGESTDVEFYPSDVFSLGITMLHLAKLALPTRVIVAWRQAEALEEAVQEEVQGLSYSDSFKALLKQMLRMDPEARPEVEDIQIQTILLLQNPVPVSISSDGAGLQDEQLPEVLLNRADKAFDEGNYQETKITLLRLLKRRKLLSKEMQWKIKRYVAFYLIYCHRHSESKALLEELVQEEMQSGRPFQTDSIQIRIQLIEGYFGAGRYSDAESLMQATLEAYDTIPHPDDRISVRLFYNHGKLQFSQGKVAEAEDTIRRALSFAKYCFEEKNEVTATIQAELGSLCTVSNKYLEGEELLRGSIEVLVERYRESSNLVSSLYLRLALNQLVQNKLKDAETLLHVTLELLQSKDDENSFEIMVAELLFYVIYRQLGDFQEADVHWQASFKRSFTHSYEGSQFPAIFALYQIIDQEQCQQWPEVERLCNQVLQHFTSDDPFRFLVRGSCYNSLGNLYRIKGKINEAEESYCKSHHELAKTLPAAHHLLQDVYSRRVLCVLLQGHMDEAKSLSAKYPGANCDKKEQEIGLQDVLSMATDLLNIISLKPYLKCNICRQNLNSNMENRIY